MYKILFFVTALCAIYCEANFIPIIIWDKSFQIPSQELIRAKRQLFGFGSFSPGGRPNHYLGGGSLFTTPNHGVSAFGSMSQNKWSRPTFGSSVDWTAPRGGLSLSSLQTPHQTSFTAAGSASILKIPDHNVNIFGSHTRLFDRKSEPLGTSTTGGVGYEHKSGGSLKLSGTHTKSDPRSPSGSQLPRETTSFTAEGSANILQTPDHKVNVKASHTRKYDQNLKPLNSSTTGGVGYQHKSGLSLNLEGIHIPSTPISGSLTGNMPVYTSKDGDTKVEIQGGLNFGGGKKPASEVNVLVEKKF